MESNMQGKKIVSLILMMTAFANSQIVYSGFIGKYPIEFAIGHVYSTGTGIEGVYLYKKFNNPIPLVGTFNKGCLQFDENKTAIISFSDFSTESKSINGLWRDLATNKELVIKLNMDHNFDAEEYSDDPLQTRDLIQANSLENYFFKLVIRKENEGSDRVIGIKIMDKKSGELFQEISNIDYEYLFEMNSVWINDYNFDGIMDFSVFEQQYAGHNSSQQYFLYNPKTKKYFNSGFEGDNLEFDPTTKTVSAVSREGVGEDGEDKYYTAEYKVANNKLVLIKEDSEMHDQKKDPADVDSN
jgi:hypothetical protein